MVEFYVLNMLEKDLLGKIEKGIIENFLVVKLMELIEVKFNNLKDVKKLESLWKFFKSRFESFFFKNEVIYNLMLKYGLYEKGG